MAVAGVAANARTLPRVLFVNANAEWHMKRLQAGSFEIVRQMLNALFVTYCRMLIRSTGPGLSRIFTAVAVYLIEMLGRSVVRFQLIIADGPGWRDTAVMTNLAEVFFAHTKQCCAVEFGIAADVIIGVRV